MKLIQCRFSSGQRVPLLVQAGNAAPLPKLIPFIYVQLKLRHRAYSTAAAHLRAIQAFYSYAESRNLDIDEAIVACDFEAILALLDGYAIWLQSGRQADNLVARIGTAAMASFPQIDSRTRDQYLRLLKQLLAPKPGEPESKTNQVDQSWYPLPCRSTPDSLAVPTKIHGDRNEKLLLSTDSSIQSKFQLLCDSLLRKCCIFALVSLAHSEACHTPALCFFPGSLLQNNGLGHVQAASLHLSFAPHQSLNCQA